MEVIHVFDSSDRKYRIVYDGYNGAWVEVMVGCNWYPSAAHHHALAEICRIKARNAKLESVVEILKRDYHLNVPLRNALDALEDTP